MPGTEYVDSVQTVLGEVGGLPFLVELASRGPAASMIGRTLAMVTELGADLQPTGWRLSGRGSLDQRRARSLLEHDLDVMEELAGGAEVLKVQLAGPCTLAASVELPRGGKALADSGARRDLTQALTAGTAHHVASVRRRLPNARLVVQLDEPALPAVLSGAVPTASGLHRYRALAAAEVASSIDEVLTAVGDAGVQTVVHCCAADVPFEVLQQTAVNSLSLDATILPTTRHDDAAAWVDAGRGLWLGVVPAVEPPEPLTDANVTRAVVELWARLDHTDIEHLPHTAVTPTCGLAGASTPWARKALELCARVAKNLSEDNGRMNA